MLANEAIEEEKAPSRPRWLNVRCYFVLYSLVILCQSMITSGYLSSILSSLEKYYGYSLERLALAFSSYDIVGIVFIPLFAYFGSGANRARLVAFGALVFACGNLLFLLPYFLFGYPSDFLRNSSNSTIDSFCHVNSSVLTAEEISPISPPSWCYSLLVVSLSLMSIGSSPFYTLGMTYLTDHLKKEDQSIYTSILYGTVALGPCVGFVLGSIFVSQWINVNDQIIALSRTDPRWIGRWWAGFLLSASLLLLLAMLLFTFPAQLHPRTSPPVDPSFLVDDLKGLFRHSTYDLIVFINALEGILVVCFTTYLVKYIQSVFHLSPSLSSVFTGVILLPSALLGTLSGGYLVRRYHLTRFGSIKMILLCSCLCFVALLSLMFVHCSSSVRYSFASECSARCHCSSHIYEPVCSSDQINYLSPCYAGCTDVNVTTKTFVDCQCASPSSSIADGMCANGCPWSLLVFFSILFVLICLETSMATPQLIIVLRTIPEHRHSLALALQNSSLKIFAQIPTPLLFGYLIDGQCLFWTSSSDNRRQSCLIYDQNHLPLILFGTMMLIKCVSLGVTCLLYFIHRRRSFQSIDDERRALLSDEQLTHS